MDDKALTVVFKGARSFLEQAPHLEQRSLFVPVPDPAPEVLANLVLHVVTDFGRVEAAARAVQLIPGAGVALVFEAFAEIEAEVGRLVEQAKVADQDSDEEGSIDVSWGRPAPRKRPVSLKDGGTLQAKIRRMSTSEKMQLALHGDRAARLALMRDTNKMLHTFVIQNAAITLDEIRYMAGYPQCNPDVLQAIAKNREWTQNPRVVSALIRNPKTPMPIALRMLDKLPMSELRVLARATGVQRAIQMAARKKVLG